MATGKYPELDACNAAQEAVENFDSTHAAKAAAIIKLGAALTQGGWAAVVFEEELRASSTPSHEPSSLVALEGETAVQIVRKRRDLISQWQAAFDAVPQEIRAAAQGPRALQSRPLDRPRRA
jgi:hypothetical protein